MESAAVNETSMTDEEKVKAEVGLRNLQRKHLHPGYELFRFATSTRPKRWLTNPWWTGFSSYQSLQGRAGLSDARIGALAREALAIFIDPEEADYNRMDVLLSVEIRRPLAGWTGTPKTISRVDKRDIGYRWEPDRSIAQFYIPGLDRLSPAALILMERKNIPGNRWTPA